MHFQKFKSSQVSAILNHNQREPEQERDRKNENINPEKTHLNYELSGHDNSYKYYQERLNEVEHINRDDINTMCGVVITLPKGYDGDTREFFETAKNFYDDRYGRENCISASVHMDETTPHMHYEFMPVVTKYSERDYQVHERLNAKEVVSRSELQRVHPEMQKYMERKLDREVNIISKEKDREYKEMERLKLETKQKELEKKERDISAREREQKERESDLKEKEQGLRLKEQEISERKEVQKDYERYFSERDNYCRSNGLTDVQYEREIWNADFKRDISQYPYPERLNPDRTEQEKREIKKSHTRDRDHEREQPQREKDYERER